MGAAYGWRRLIWPADCVNGCLRTWKHRCEAAMTDGIHAVTRSEHIPLAVPAREWSTYCHATRSSEAWIKYTLYENTPTAARGFHESNRCRAACSDRDESTRAAKANVPAGTSSM